jgi:hypothetical protein
MIRDVEVRYREESVWARGNEYKAELASYLFDFKEGKVLFKRHYNKGTPTETVWNDMRDNLSNYFIEIMYPGIVQRTITLRGPPKTGATTKYVTVTDPDGNQRWVTRHIRDRQAQLPDFYIWNRNNKIDKLVLSPQGYQALLESRGGGLNVGIGGNERRGMRKGRTGIASLDAIQEANHGKTVTITVFIYPDNYDEEVRAAFDLIITFW